jgi:8-oxo-dGTP diphosphatase
MAAGALCCDQLGRVLLVDPSYRDTWDLPGGVVEAEESPHAACRREVAEEIGLTRPVGRILAIDWVPSQPNCPEEMVLIYDGGVLDSAEIGSIVVADGEIDGFGFFAPPQVDSHVRPVVARRIGACLEALATQTVAALENGRAIHELAGEGATVASAPGTAHHTA